MAPEVLHTLEPKQVFQVGLKRHEIAKDFFAGGFGNFNFKMYDLK